MSKFLITTMCFLLVASGFGCGSGTPANTNAASNSNKTATVNLDPNNLPPGLSASPVPLSANATPGIPANVSQLPKGATPTPGIPSPAEIKKGIKPGLTPTPGIPSQEQLRKMLNQPGNINIPPPANSNTPTMMNKRKLRPGKPQ